MKTATTLRGQVDELNARWIQNNAEAERTSRWPNIDPTASQKAAEAAQEANREMAVLLQSVSQIEYDTAGLNEILNTSWDEWQ